MTGKLDALAQAQLLDAAKQGDEAAFTRLLSRYRRELLGHCYRMVGSAHDAEDALQEALLAIWKGLPSFQSRSSLRTWLYQVTTNACLRFLSGRPRRILSPDHGPAFKDPHQLGEPMAGPVWLEPWLDDVADAGDHEGGEIPDARALRLEKVELAFIAALQHLPGTQRAVLILREVIELSAEEVAEMLEMTVAAVNSVLQRARAGVAERVPRTDQKAELGALGEAGVQRLVIAFVAAWERADLPALVQLLTEDVRFTMPPLPAWFSGRDDVARFFGERVFATPWRLAPLSANGQLALGCYMQAPGDDRFRLAAVNLLAVRDGLIRDIAAFLDTTVLSRSGLPPEWDPAKNPASDR